MEQPFFPRGTLRTRVTVATLLMLIPLLVAAGASVMFVTNSLQSMNGSVDRMARGTFPLSELQVRILKARAMLHEQALAGGFSASPDFASLGDEINASFREALDNDPLTSAGLNRLEQAHADWQKARQASDALTSKRDPSQAATLLKSFDSRVDSALNSLEYARDSVRDEVLSRERSRVAEVTQQLIIVNGLVLAAGAALALLISFAVGRSILRPLRTLEEGTHRIGEGDLFHRVVLDSKDEMGRLAGAFNTMAEKLERGQATLENLSVHDGLTGLYNYREFRRRLKEEADRSRRYGRPFSLLLLDLDHFKIVNDTHGHQAGDEVLRSLANLISQGVRPVDKVARYGGEEIALILPETPGGKALVVAERVRSLVANHAINLSSGITISLTCSLGVAAFGEDGASDNEIIGAADSALYAAKHAGRNRVCRLEKT